MLKSCSAICSPITLLWAQQCCGIFSLGTLSALAPLSPFLSRCLSFASRRTGCCRVCSTRPTLLPVAAARRFRRPTARRLNFSLDDGGKDDEEQKGGNADEDGLTAFQDYCPPLPPIFPRYLVHLKKPWLGDARPSVWQRAAVPQARGNGSSSGREERVRGVVPLTSFFNLRE